jgi:hypothetical protein
MTFHGKQEWRGMASSGLPTDSDPIAARFATLRARSLIMIGLAATVGWIAVLCYVLLTHLFRAA